MEWFVLQLIIVIIAPWALKYIRKARNIHTSITEIIATVTILSLVLSFTSSSLDKLSDNSRLSPQEQIEQLNKNIINFTDWINSNVIIIVFKIVISEILGIVSGALTYLIDWIAKRKRHNIYW